MFGGAVDSEVASITHMSTPAATLLNDADRHWFAHALLVSVSRSPLHKWLDQLNRSRCCEVLIPLDYWLTGDCGYAVYNSGATGFYDFDADLECADKANLVPCFVSDGTHAPGFFFRVRYLKQAAKMAASISRPVSPPTIAPSTTELMGLFLCVSSSAGILWCFQRLR